MTYLISAVSRGALSPQLNKSLIRYITSVMDEIQSRFRGCAMTSKWERAIGLTR